MSRAILVTAANAGIGFELVRLLTEKGHTVYLGARNPTSGKEALDKLISEGFKTVKLLAIDVNSPSSIKAAAQTINAAEGKLDVLTATIRETVETNIYDLIETCKAFVPILRKSATGAPVILNVSTDMASNTLQAEPDSILHVVAYNTSKAAANSYTIALARELRGEGFKVNAVTPGFTSAKLNGFREGGKSIKQGAEALAPWALLDKEAKTGLFIDEHQKEMQW